jgi:hypothetical protein
MKLPILTLAFATNTGHFFRPPATHSLHRAGHSRTLYTSIAPEQSNIIISK